MTIFPNTLFPLMRSITVEMASNIKTFATSCWRSSGANRTIRDVLFTNYGNKKGRLAISANRRLYFRALPHATALCARRRLSARFPVPVSLILCQTAMSLRRFSPPSHPVRESPLRRVPQYKREEWRRDEEKRATSGRDGLALTRKSERRADGMAWP